MVFLSEVLFVSSITVFRGLLPSSACLPADCACSNRANLLTVAEICRWREDQKLAIFESLFHFNATHHFVAKKDRNTLGQPTPHRPYIRLAALALHTLPRDDETGLLLGYGALFKKIGFDAQLRLDDCEVRLMDLYFDLDGSLLSIRFGIDLHERPVEARVCIGVGHNQRRHAERDFGDV